MSPGQCFAAAAAVLNFSVLGTAALAGFFAVTGAMEAIGAICAKAGDIEETAAMPEMAKRVVRSKAQCWFDRRMIKLRTFST